MEHAVVVANVVLRDHLAVFHRSHVSFLGQGVPLWSNLRHEITEIPSIGMQWLRRTALIDAITVATEVALERRVGIGGSASLLPLVTLMRGDQNAPSRQLMLPIVFTTKVPLRNVEVALVQRGLNR